MSSKEEQKQSPTRNLPGFLRRSLRMNYSDEQEETEQSSPTVWATSAASKAEDESKDPPTKPAQEAPRAESLPTLTRKDMEETKSESTAEETPNSVEQSSSSSWTHVPHPPSQQLEHAVSYKEAMFEKAIGADVVSMSDLRKLAWNGIPVCQTVCMKLSLLSRQSHERCLSSLASLNIAHKLGK